MPESREAPQPQIGRVILGFALAPLVFTLFLAVLSESRSTDFGALEFWFSLLPLFVVVFLIAAAVTVAVGIQGYFVLCRFIYPSLPLVAVLAGILAIVPPLMFVFSSPNLLIEFGGVAITDVRSLVMIFSCGVSAGAAFWLCAYWHDPAFSRRARL